MFAIYVMDFSINAGTCRPGSWCLLLADPSPLQYIVQAVDRALVIDVLPTGLQPAGNAWAATMLGAGSVSGFFAFVSTNAVSILLLNSELQGKY